MKRIERSSPNLRLNILCLSVCYIAIGVVLLMFPGMALKELCYAIGLILIIVGIVNVAVYFIKKSYTDRNNFGFSAGVAAALLGLFAVVRTQEFSVAFSQVLALCMIFDSILKLQFSMDLLRIRSKRWWLILLVALLMAALSMLIVIDPFQGADPSVRGIYTYCVLIADGIINIATSVYLSWEFRKFEKNQRKEEAESK